MPRQLFVIPDAILRSARSTRLRTEDLLKLSATR